MSSELIREAVAATRSVFGEPPAIGMVTFVNLKKVKPKDIQGWCYRRAGFKAAGETKGGLMALRLPPHKMPAASLPYGGQPSLPLGDVGLGG